MSVASGGLPPGLSFTFKQGENGAEINGTPSKAGTYRFNVSAWCFGMNVSGQTGNHDYELIVK